MHHRAHEYSDRRTETHELYPTGSSPCGFISLASGSRQNCKRELGHGARSGGGARTHRKSDHLERLAAETPRTRRTFRKGVERRGRPSRLNVPFPERPTAHEQSPVMPGTAAVAVPDLQ